MVNKCKEENCKVTPCFNYKGETKGLYCSKHKLEKMIDVRNINKLCQENNCNIRASYNYEGQKKGIYCATHKKEHMFNVIDKTCCEKGCRISPSYNYYGNKFGIYCAKHKKENMIDVVSKVCEEIGCNIKPSYNYKGEIKGIYCEKHKKENMINVKAKVCKEDGCKAQPSYNYKGESGGLYCSKHKKENMIDNIHKKCIENNCNKIPSFNYKDNTTGLYCYDHKKGSMIDVTHNRCKNEWCDIILTNKKYDGYCLFCFINTFPDKPVSRNYKTKERATVEFVLQNFPDFTWITDKKIQDGCSRRRPDLLLDLGYQVIIIEIDENQHCDYNSSCENKRIMELSQDVNFRPIVFIRFNPDDYLINDKNITSCWGQNKQGICTIKKSKKKEWNERLNLLKEKIEFYSKEENKSEKTIEMIHLFYDK